MFVIRLIEVVFLLLFGSVFVHRCERECEWRDPKQTQSVLKYFPSFFFFFPWISLLPIFRIHFYGGQSLPEDWYHHGFDIFTKYYSMIES